MSIRVTIWNENVHEQTDAGVRAMYPGGVHGAVADLLKCDEEFVITTVTLAMPECGLTEELLQNTDVLFWWGHIAHERVPEEIAERVANHVRAGMGLIALHSAHESRPFKKLMGTTCRLRWRDDTREHVWLTDPSHPIAKGVPASFTLEKEEMYGEYFDIPKPDSVVFLSWFSTGNVFRSGVTFTRGRGRIFYFQPGHESNPSFHNPNVGLILRNAAHWAAPVSRLPAAPASSHEQDPLEKQEV